MASDFTLPTAETIRDSILRTVRAGLMSIGVANPNVTPGSDEYVRAQGLGDQIEVAMANCQVKADGMLPDTASDDDLKRLLAIYGMAFRDAAGAVGNLTFDSTLSATITTGQQLIDGAGLRFEVLVGGLYNNGDSIPVEGVDTGIETNHSQGDVLRWVVTPAGSQSTAAVAVGGLTGGVDAEDNETARQRLYDRLRNPPAAGNSQHLAGLLEDSSTLVQKAFISPACNGPSNYGAAVCGYTTATSKSRVVSPIIVANVIKPYVDGICPEYVDSIVTSVTDSPFDMSVQLTLPASPKAAPAGPGGGWTDGTSWPRNVNALATFKCSVVSVTSSTRFIVDAPSSPIAGITQIAWLSPVDWTLYTATVTALGTVVVGTSVEVFIDRPFPNIATGHLISPNAVNIQAYFDAIIDHFALMGPGEKVATSSASFYRAFRHPTPAQSWPCKVDATMLRAITDSGDEVQSAEFLFRTSNLAPTVPATVALAPSVYVPRHLSLYEKLD